MLDEAQTALRFTLLAPARFSALQTLDQLWAAPSVATLEWPADREVDALVWVRDVLLAPRLGDPKKAWSALRSGYQGRLWPHPWCVGAIEAAELQAALAPPPPAHFLFPEWSSAVTTLLSARPRPEEDLLLISRGVSVPL